MADDNEGEGPVSDTQLLEEISTRKREVDLLLSKKNKAKALEVSLQNPPVATKTAEVKVDYSLQRHKTFCTMTITANFCLSLSLSLSVSQDANTEIIEKVLAAISDSELAGLVGDLDIELCEVLMKYVYRIMEKAANSSSLLKLHALLVDKAGPGCIVRVMTDRKTV
jgi:hypothetical protein